MAYRIRISRETKRQVDELPGHVRQRVREIITSLAEEPRPGFAKELRDEPGYFRIALMRWRVIYRVDDDGETVVVLAVRVKSGPETYADFEG